MEPVDLHALRPLDDRGVVIVDVAVGLALGEDILRPWPYALSATPWSAQFMMSQWCNACSTIQSPERARFEN